MFRKLHLCRHDGVCEESEKLRGKLQTAPHQRPHAPSRIHFRVRGDPESGTPTCCVRALPGQLSQRGCGPGPASQLPSQVLQSELSAQGGSLNEKLSPAGPALLFLIVERGPEDQCGLRSLRRDSGWRRAGCLGSPRLHPASPLTPRSPFPQTQRWTSPAPTPGDADTARHSVSKENPRAGRPRRTKTQDFPHQKHG